MSDVRRAKYQLLVVIAVVTSISVLVLWLVSGSDSFRMNLVRDQIDAVISAASRAKRGEHAEQCIHLATPLMQSQGQQRTLATMFVICISPLVSGEATTVLPSASEVQELESADLIRISQLLFNTGRHSPADQIIGFVLRRADDYRESALKLAATIRFDLGRDDEVLEHCDELIQLDPRNSNAYRVSAMVHKNHGRWEQFIEATTQVLAINYDSALQRELIDAFLRLGQYQRARAEFDDLVSNGSDTSIISSVLHARLLQQEGRTGESGLLLSRIAHQENSSPECVTLYASILLEQKKFEAAASLLERAKARSPASEQIYYLLGQAYARQGNDKLARKQLERHRVLLNTKVQLHELEELAAKQPYNVTVREELAKTYADIGLFELAEFWQHASEVAKD